MATMMKRNSTKSYASNSIICDITDIILYLTNNIKFMAYPQEASFSKVYNLGDIKFHSYLEKTMNV